ncbi:MAG: DUF3597 family protein, partial [Sphingomonas sp.]|nr:DUF3597 family protein [Sphingomonas sp.]
MSIFSKIRDAIFGHKSAPAQPAPTPHPQTGQGGTQTQTAPQQTQAPAQPVDVEAVLAHIAREKGNPDLNYK